MRFTALQKREAASREVTMRLKCYPDFVKKGRLTPKEANYQIDIMREIASDYEREAAAELLL